MTVALRRYPRRIDPLRESRNGSIPVASFLGRLIHASTHVQAYRRKTWMTYSNWDTLPAGGASDVEKLRFYCRTGHGKDIHMAFNLGMGLANAAATDPRAVIEVTQVGGATTTLEVRHGLSDGTSTDSPNEITRKVARVALSADTAYSVLIKEVNYGRVIDACAYEEASNVIDPSVNYHLNPEVAATGYPIYDSTRERILAGMSQLWRHNAAQSIVFPGSGDGSKITRTGSTGWINVLDATSTTVTDNTPGYLWYGDVAGPEAWCRRSDSNTIDCVFAVYGRTVGGSTGEVRLEGDTGTVCSLTGITSTSGWHTSNVTVNVEDWSKVDLHMRVSNAGHTLELEAVSLVPYLA